MTASPSEQIQAEPETERLANDLASTVSGEVRFDAASRHLYANGASIYRYLPIGVVIPKTRSSI